MTDISLFDISQDSLLTSGALDQTFLLLMGDHGFRMDFSWGGTDQGKTEATMPALAVLAPQQFRNQYPDKAQDKRTLSISYYRVSQKNWD